MVVPGLMGMQRRARVRNDTHTHTDRNKDRRASLETDGGWSAGCWRVDDVCVSVWPSQRIPSFTSVAGTSQLHA